MISVSILFFGKVENLEKILESVGAIVRQAGKVIKFPKSELFLRHTYKPIEIKEGDTAFFPKEETKPLAVAEICK